MSHFYQRKIRTYFQRLDYNNDGLVTEDDFLLMAKKFGALADDKTKKDVKIQLVKIFQAYNKAAGGHGKITEDQMVECLKKLRSDPEFPKILEAVADVCFRLLDTDGDGFVREPEYAKMLCNMSIPDYEGKAKIAFAAMDTDHDGKLSAEESKQGFYDYLMSDDETLPGSLFFGPFV